MKFWLRQLRVDGEVITDLPDRRTLKHVAVTVHQGEHRSRQFLNLETVVRSRKCLNGHREVNPAHQKVRDVAATAHRADRLNPNQVHRARLVAIIALYATREAITNRRR